MEMDDQIFNKNLLALEQTLFNRARQLTRDLNEANDLIQETFVKAIKNRSQFVDGSNFKGWLYVIMKNIFLNGKRRIKIINNRVLVKDFLSESDLSRSSVQNLAINRLVKSDIYESFKKLNDMYYIPFIMHFEGFKYYEIAQHLQIPEGTVKTRIHFARKALQKELQVYR